MNHLLLYMEWWTELGTLRQTYWSLAIVASLLLLILIATSILGWFYDADNETQKKERDVVWINARWTLTFFAVFGWAGLLCSYGQLSIQWCLFLSTLAGVIAALISRRVASFLIYYPRFNAGFEATDLRETIGEVLQPIPPHRNGFGKVHLDKRGTPYEIEAITAGQELPSGVPIRVIDVIDGRVLLVEPIRKEPLPRKQSPQAPPGHIE
ncbi:MAG: hypothetical protein DHS20C18_39170 [Saprospiraceae bacterium]|nr:MAG: hypothetical protein DHS20C18_39170 [Saprospiraceae bacterium]